ncbi:hypothetical protein F5880DRAFT_1280810, partial [Lentinula raphanica]
MIPSGAPSSAPPNPQSTSPGSGASAPSNHQTSQNSNTSGPQSPLTSPDPTPSALSAFTLDGELEHDYAAARAAPGAGTHPPGGPATGLGAPPAAPVRSDYPRPSSAASAAPNVVHPTAVRPTSSDALGSPIALSAATGRHAEPGGLPRAAAPPVVHPPGDTQATQARAVLTSPRYSRAGVRAHSLDSPQRRKYPAAAPLLPGATGPSFASSGQGVHLDLNLPNPFFLPDDEEDDLTGLLSTTAEPIAKALHEGWGTFIPIAYFATRFNNQLYFTTPGDSLAVRDMGGQVSFHRADTKL